MELGETLTITSALSTTTYVALRSKTNTEVTIRVGTPSGCSSPTISKQNPRVPSFKLSTNSLKAPNFTKYTNNVNNNSSQPTEKNLKGWVMLATPPPASYYNIAWLSAAALPTPRLYIMMESQVLSQPPDVSQFEEITSIVEVESLANGGNKEAPVKFNIKTTNNEYTIVTNSFMTSGMRQLKEKVVPSVQPSNPPMKTWSSVVADNINNVPQPKAVSPTPRPTKPSAKTSPKSKERESNFATIKTDKYATLNKREANTLTKPDIKYATLNKKDVKTFNNNNESKYATIRKTDNKINNKSTPINKTDNKFATIKKSESTTIKSGLKNGTLKKSESTTFTITEPNTITETATIKKSESSSIKKELVLPPSPGETISKATGKPSLTRQLTPFPDPAPVPTEENNNLKPAAVQILAKKIKTRSTSMEAFQQVAPVNTRPQRPISINVYEQIRRSNDVPKPNDEAEKLRLNSQASKPEKMLMKALSLILEDCAKTLRNLEVEAESDFSDCASAFSEGMSDLEESKMNGLRESKNLRPNLNLSVMNASIQDLEKLDIMDLREMTKGLSLDSIKNLTPQGDDDDEAYHADDNSSCFSDDLSDTESSQDVETSNSTCFDDALCTEGISEDGASVTSSAFGSLALRGDKHLGLQKIMKSTKDQESKENKKNNRRSLVCFSPAQEAEEMEKRRKEKEAKKEARMSKKLEKKQMEMRKEEQRRSLKLEKEQRKSMKLDKEQRKSLKLEKEANRKSLKVVEDTSKFSLKGAVRKLFGHLLQDA